MKIYAHNIFIRISLGTYLSESYNKTAAKQDLIQQKEELSASGSTKEIISVCVKSQLFFLFQLFMHVFWVLKRIVSFSNHKIYFG